MHHSREAETFIPIFERRQLPRDGALIVHSGIATISRNGFRAEAIIEVFLEYLSGGLLLMPTMTWRTITPENPNWDELQTPSHTGVMSEIFRTRYATARSVHPTHSVAACGIDAELLLSRHHIDDTPVSQNSPYGLLRDYDTFILMIGVGLEHCTAIHLPEEVIAPEIYVRPANQTEIYQCRDRHGRLHSVRTRRHWRLDRNFPKFGPALRQKGDLESGEIEGCPYQIVPMRSLLRDVFRTLIRNPQGTLRNGDNTGTTSAIV
jgi:aminoglycoside 3-N-acetyltransferase